MQGIFSWFASFEECKPGKKKSKFNSKGALQSQEKEEVNSQAEEGDNCFTFEVHQVIQNDQIEEELIPAEEMFRKQANCKAKLEDFSWKTGTEGGLIYQEMNGILNAIRYAYVNHHPIKLSVSDFILMIGQGLAKHLEIHAEELRKYFVNFKEKEQIAISRPDLIPGKKNDWSSVFGQFSEQIKKRVKTSLYDIVIDDTSVATKITRIASEIALMDVHKQYFEYEAWMGCGFPKMTLVGTPDDWEMLRTKVRKLKELNAGDKLMLDWWLERLVPLVETMVDQAKSRNVDKDFWGSIYQVVEKSALYFSTEMVSGWIKVFQPYLQHKKHDKYERGPDYYRSEFEDIHPDNLISGISKVPFLWKSRSGEGIDMNFFGGFLGAKMVDDGTIEPVYFYAVAFDDE